MILKQLAEEYQQLYLKPERGRSQSEKYLKIIKKGSEAEIKSLEHFIGSSGDRFYKEKTPAGEISILQLGNRKDFDMFLQIMLYRCEPEEVPKNTGAMTLNGIVNWRKIHQHKEEFLKEYAKGRLRNYLSEEDLCTQNLNLTATLTFQKMCRLKDEIDNLNWESPYDVIEPLLQLHPALEGNLK